MSFKAKGNFLRDSQVTMINANSCFADRCYQMTWAQFSFHLYQCDIMCFITHGWLSPAKKELMSLVHSLFPWHIFPRDQLISFHWDDGALLNTGIWYIIQWFGLWKQLKTAGTLYLAVRNRWGTGKIFTRGSWASSRGAFTATGPGEAFYKDGTTLPMWQHGNVCANR